MAATLMVGIGELLWDLFPNGRSLGGAPSNFAYHASLLGNRGVIASRLGNDEPGHEALRELSRMGVEADYVQIDLEHLTGTVGVKIDGRGEPHFTVNPDSAWDYLTLTHAWEDLAREAQVICFGTLGQRCPRAGDTIRSFLKFSRLAALRIFDINLRHCFFSVETLVSSLETANVVKFNSEELSVAARLLGLRGAGEAEFSRQLIGLYNLDLVALTRSEKGSLLFTERGMIEHKGYRVEVADTIGCGDAFTAALAHCLMRGLPLEEASEAANLMGAWVATRTGATPAVSPETIEEILSGLKALKN